MLALEITLQIFGIVALGLLIYVLVYLIKMLKRVDTKLDSLLELIGYYEKFKVMVTDFMEGPGRIYLEKARAILSFVVPLLTRRRKSK